MNSLISVIVPVYNVEDYLKECVDSIIYQDYRNIEIILVDDGSKDSSGEICESYKKLDSRVIVIHKENGGLSDARNFGIEASCGEYICFIDGDDFISKDYISSMVKHFSDYPTMIIACGFCRYYEDGKIEQINKSGVCSYYDGEEAQKYLNISGYYNQSACNKLYYRELFDNIKFPKGKNSEDTYVMYRLIEKSGGIFYDSEVKYYYRQRSGSISKSSNVNYDSIQASYNVFKHYKDRMWTKALPFAAQAAIFANIGAFNGVLCNPEISENPKEDKEKFINNAKKLMKYKTYDKLSIPRKIQLFLFLHFRTLYINIFKIYVSYRNRKYKRY